jgi:tetratricopeptide (TPR) repeat protein
MLGYSRARITQILNILKLPLEIRQGLLLVDHVTEFHLRPLVKIDDDRRQLSMFRKLMADKLTGRQMALFAAADGKAGEETAPEAAVMDLEALIASSGAGEATPPNPVEAPAPEELPEKPLPAEEPLPPEHLQKHHARTLPPSEPPVTVSPAAAAQRSTHARARAMLEGLGTLREKGWEAEAVKLGVTGPERLFLEGVSLLRRGIYAQASEMLVQLVHTQPENAPAWFFLGRCQNLLENHPLAEQYLRTACELIPDDPDYLCELAIVLERQKRYSEASTFYRKAGSIRKAAMARGRKA